MEQQAVRTADRPSGEIASKQALDGVLGVDNITRLDASIGSHEEQPRVPWSGSNSDTEICSLDLHSDDCIPDLIRADL